MSLYLTNDKITKLLNNRKIIISKKKLLQYLLFTKDNFNKFTNLTSKCKQNLNDIDTKHINPLSWQIGHVIFFYSNLILKNLDNCQNIDYIENYNNYVDFYDSWKTPVENRIGELLIPHTKCLKYYNIIITILINYINNNEIGKKESYLIMLGILHNEMHNEAFIFTKLKINNTLPEQFNFKIEELCPRNLIKNIDFISYKSGEFIQGSNDSKDYLIFDNEMPSFKTKLNSFKISKYPITEYQYLQFIKEGGYIKNEYWSPNGIKWKDKYNIELPLYWQKVLKNTENNKYYYEYFKTINNKKLSVETNLPIVHISYYEANAFCKWMNGRLPTETEYEYVSTNGGKTIYPWGNGHPNDELCNLNYKNTIQSVNEYKMGNNKKGISQLIGNVWEWCQEPIYPYNGFVIDPVYREMSYPFFGFKRICKGGAFCVPDFLIHPRYRNAQYPDCRIQFIGFRICKD